MTLLAQVVPDLPTFDVDDGFGYLVPDGLHLGVGDLVRVALGGRRRRGWVVGLRRARPDRTFLPVAARSGDLPVLDPGLLGVARWVAARYVAPLAAVLRRCTPPNLPRRHHGPVPSLPRDGPPDPTGGARHAYVLGGPDTEVVAGILRTALAGGNAIVTAPTVVEARRLAESLEDHLSGRVLLATSELTAAQRTRAWSRVNSGTGSALVGTREVALWRVPDLRAIVIAGEGRRGLKSPQSPTFHAREVLRRRAAIGRARLVYVGFVPTLEALTGGPLVVATSPRPWPLVEVADRAEEPPGTGPVLERTRVAIRTVAARRGSCFVLAPRRAATLRCVRCHTLRRCADCGSTVAASCPRCGRRAGPCPCGARRFEPLGAGVDRVVADLRRSLSRAVGPAGSGTPVEVGTERDLVGREGLDLAVAIDPDASLLAPSYRAAEETLRLLARLAGAVARGRGRRCLLQTSLPEHPVYRALRLGRPLPFLEEERREREAAGLPPAGEVLAIEVRGGDPDGELRRISEGAAVVHGPASAGEARRWLVQGPDLGEVRLRLRSLVQRLRDTGATVRIDVDPLEL